MKYPASWSTDSRMKPKPVSREATHQSGKIADIINKKPKKRLMVQIEVENADSETRHNNRVRIEFRIAHHLFFHLCTT